MHVLAITKSLIAISWTEHNRWTSPICAVINVPFNSSFVMQQNNDLGKALFFRVIIQSVTGASVTDWIYCNLADIWALFTKIRGSELTIHFT